MFNILGVEMAFELKYLDEVVRYAVENTERQFVRDRSFKILIDPYRVSVHKHLSAIQFEDDDEGEGYEFVYNPALICRIRDYEPNSLGLMVNFIRYKATIGSALRSITGNPEEVYFYVAKNQRIYRVPVHGWRAFDKSWKVENITKQIEMAIN